MKEVSITEYHESTSCNWCDRTKECVTVEFEDGFLSKGPMCWPCLQKSVRARNRQEQNGKQTAPQKLS
jgi:hypothetical protein